MIAFTGCGDDKNGSIPNVASGSASVEQLTASNADPVPKTPCEAGHDELADTTLHHGIVRRIQSKMIDGGILSWVEIEEKTGNTWLVAEGGTVDGTTQSSSVSVKMSVGDSVVYFEKQGDYDQSKEALVVNYANAGVYDKSGSLHLLWGVLESQDVEKYLEDLANDQLPDTKDACPYAFR